MPHTCLQKAVPYAEGDAHKPYRRGRRLAASYQQREQQAAVRVVCQERSCDHVPRRQVREAERRQSCGAGSLVNEVQREQERRNLLRLRGQGDTRVSENYVKP